MSSNEYRFMCQCDMTDARIDRCIADVYEDMSRSYIQKLIKDGLVFVNGRICKASHRVCEGDIISFSAPELKLPDIAAEDIPLDIIYEDNDVIVVNKPKGMVVHPAPGHYSGTLVNALMYHCGKDLSGINGVMRPGIVHRIDMDTTGSLLVCKNDRAHMSIAAQLKEHSIKRIYTAVAHGVFRDDTGRIAAPIGRSEKNRKMMAVNVKNSKEAVTNYRVIERYPKYTMLECRLETGRTHQIRVHLSSIGHPIAGDELYCTLKPPCKLEGQALHAGTIGFVHPATGVYMEFTAPLPEYFDKLKSVISC
jgi:23S rRNA pseudouridine1911/1915/1917 synthase